MKSKMNKEITYHRMWLLALLAGGYSTIAFSTEHAAPEYREQQRSVCPCSVGLYATVIVAARGGDLLHEHTDNNACAVIIKHPIGDVERRVNHLGEYHE